MSETLVLTGDFGVISPVKLKQWSELYGVEHRQLRRWIARGKERRLARSIIERLDVRCASPSQPILALSGGNQQKVVVAREFGRSLSALVLDQPTRGLDVGSVEFIHRQVIRRRDSGAAVLLVSAELDEVMELSDRIAVMYRGEVVALLDARTADREEVGLLMATGRQPGQATTVGAA